VARDGGEGGGEGGSEGGGEGKRDCCGEDGGEGGGAAQPLRRRNAEAAEAAEVTIRAPSCQLAAARSAAESAGKAGAVDATSAHAHSAAVEPEAASLRPCNIPA
jgi:hypothetical protein